MWFERTGTTSGASDVLDWMRSSMRSSEDIAAYTRGDHRSRQKAVLTTLCP